MLRDGRLRDPGPSRQSPDRLLSFAAQSFEESPPSRIGERQEPPAIWNRPAPVVSGER